MTLLVTKYITSNGEEVSSLTVADTDKILMENGTYKLYSEIAVGEEAVTKDHVFQQVKFGSPE